MANHSHSFPALPPAAEAGGSSDSSTAVVDQDVDFANYFCTYGYLYHQKEMLSDRVRMDAYYNASHAQQAPLPWKSCRHGEWHPRNLEPQVDAKKVYAVEATKMSENARALVKANDVNDIVEVIEGSIEDVTLSKKG